MSLLNDFTPSGFVRSFLLSLSLCWFSGALKMPEVKYPPDRRSTANLRTVKKDKLFSGAIQALQGLNFSGQASLPIFNGFSYNSALSGLLFDRAGISTGLEDIWEAALSWFVAQFSPCFSTTHTKNLTFFLLSPAPRKRPVMLLGWHIFTGSGISDGAGNVLGLPWFRTFKCTVQWQHLNLKAL